MDEKVLEPFFEVIIICRRGRYKAMKNTICVVGGDLRQIRLLELLEKEGYNISEVALFGEDFNYDTIKNAGVLVLPMPVSFDGVYINAPFSKRQISFESLLEQVSSDCFVLGGRITKEMEELLTKK